VRVILDRARAVRARTAKGAAGRSTSASAPASGIAYLTRKKATRDANAELTEHAHDTVAALYDRLAARSSAATRKAAGELRGRLRAHEAVVDRRQERRSLPSPRCSSAPLT